MTAPATTYTLPPLPYAYDALEPHISSQIMTLHHTKHHQTYITSLNGLLSQLRTATSSQDIITQIQLQPGIAFHAGGHINHTLFWESLTPPSSANSNPTSAPKLTKKISERWGSLETFQAQFGEVLKGIKGSGWGWLVVDIASGGLEILTSKDQEIPPAGKKPLLGIDMWEHAYYLQYLNDKASYVNGIWKIVNWKNVEGRYEGSVEGVFGGLAGLRSNI